MTAQTTGGNVVATTAAAATTAGIATTAQVPRLVRFSGTATDVGGNAASSIIGVTFSLYAEPTGGAPLWSEVQNVQVDKTGHYTVMIGCGTTDYIPLWTNASNLTSSVIFQSSGHEIGIGTSNPVTPLEVNGNNSISIVDVTQTGSAGSAIAGDVTATR